MDCQQYHDMLDDLLVAVPGDAIQAEALEHASACPNCAEEHRRAGRALSALAARVPCSPPPCCGRESSAKLPAIATDENRNNTLASRANGWSLAQFATSKLAMAVAASVVAIGAFLLWRSGGEGQFDSPAFTLLNRAYAAERTMFQSGRVVHIVNEILVRPIADPALANARWFPIVSLEATGKQRFHQLSLAAKPVEDYTVTDECWYEAASGRFVRKLSCRRHADLCQFFRWPGRVLVEHGLRWCSQVEKHATTNDFHPPQNPESLLGIAAGLPARLDEKDKHLVTDAGEVPLDDGTKGRQLRVSYPPPEADAKQDAYVLFTIRNDDNRIARIEFVVDGKSLYEVRRVKTETIDRADIAWNLAGIVDAAAESKPVPPASIVPDMVVRDVAVKHMIEKASFPTYIFQSNPIMGRRTANHGYPRHREPAQPHVRNFVSGPGRPARRFDPIGFLQPDVGADDEVRQSHLHFAQRHQSPQQRPRQMVGGNPAAKLASDHQ